MFKELKNLMAMQQKMREVKDRLENTVFSVDGPCGVVRIEMTGAQEVKEAAVLKPLQELSREILQRDIKEAYNKAVAHSRELAAKEMKDIAGFDVPGIS